jgi:hypothetical protein
VLASEVVYGLDKAAVEIRRPPQARDLGPVVLPHRSLNPLPPGHCSLYRHPKVGRPKKGKVFQPSEQQTLLQMTSPQASQTVYVTDD